MRKIDLLAVLLSIAGILVSAYIAIHVFDQMPHMEDEFAYVWQANAISEGKLTVPSPNHPKSFLVPFVIDHNGARFGKYPLGFPALLAIGIFLGFRTYVNPLLAGFAIWLTYSLGKRILNPVTGLLAAGLTLSSPFFLMNSSTLLSHPFGLVLSASLAITWLDAFTNSACKRKRLAAILAGLSLGCLILTRPLTSLGIAIPFAIHGIFLYFRGSSEIRKHLLLVGVITGLSVFLHFTWQFVLTGDPLLNPYTLWWDYDKFGFGPGFGVTNEGHSLHQARINTMFSLKVGLSDLFGWGKLSWIFLPFGLWAIRRNRAAWLVFSIFPSLIIAYLPYWVGASLFGPRYYYEGLFSLTLVTAAGILYVAGRLSEIPGKSSGKLLVWKRGRFFSVILLVSLLVALNGFYYIPARVFSMHNLYEINKTQLEPFLSQKAQNFAPALIIVHAENWRQYAALIDLENPSLTSPFIFAISRGTQKDDEMANDYPGRHIFHYYPDRPNQLYPSSLP